ncbi:hypothetical protein SD77_4034 [Bacillus badius]|uniref:Uncharacterized protein n=1 Tax=Bacillus badius TaxID=1455 RepID=A0ABR5AUM8_BACBA|nr:hypothetical protein SD77_4034 [Bacillus badius]
MFSPPYKLCAISNDTAFAADLPMNCLQGITKKLIERLVKQALNQF